MGEAKDTRGNGPVGRPTFSRDWSPLLGPAKSDDRLRWPLHCAPDSPHSWQFETVRLSPDSDRTAYRRCVCTQNVRASGFLLTPAGGQPCSNIAREHWTETDRADVMFSGELRFVLYNSNGWKRTEKKKWYALLNS